MAFVVFINSQVYEINSQVHEMNSQVYMIKVLGSGKTLWKRLYYYIIVYYEWLSSCEGSQVNVNDDTIKLIFVTLSMVRSMQWSSKRIYD